MFSLRPPNMIQRVTCAAVKCSEFMTVLTPHHSQEYTLIL